LAGIVVVVVPAVVVVGRPARVVVVVGPPARVVVVIGPAVGTVVVVSAGTFTTVDPGDVVGGVVAGGAVVAGDVVLGTLAVVVAAGVAGLELGNERSADGTTGEGEPRDPAPAALAGPTPPRTGKVSSDRRVITPIRPSSDRHDREVALLGPRPDPTPAPERAGRVKIPPGPNSANRPTNNEKSRAHPLLSWRRSYSRGCAVAYVNSGAEPTTPLCPHSLDHM